MKAKTAVMPAREDVSLDPAVANRLTLILGGLGLVGLGVSAAGLAVDRAQLFFSYLIAFVFSLSLSLGTLFFVLIQHLTGARWSVVVRRLAETVMANFPVLAFLFLPILFGLHELYPWMGTEAAHDALLQEKAPYLNSTFLVIRLVVYFGVWIGLSRYFYTRSLAVDESGDPTLIQRMRAMSAPGVPLFGLTATFAAFDLLMSLDPHWYSTIFGVYFFAGCAVTAFSLIAFIALVLRYHGKLVVEITYEHYHDLGKLMFGFTVFWAYIAFSQFVLIWYANIPEETVFYLHRWEGSWKGVSLFLLFGHFVLPFAILMSRHVKRKLVILGAMTVWIMFMQFVDILWLVLPNLQHHGYHFHWLDVSTLVGVMGISAAAIVRRLGQSPMIPLKDPMLTHSLEFENA